MKKVILSIFFVCAVATAAIAQPRAIGARIGYNVEFSYQHNIATNWMFDLTAGATNYWSSWGRADVTMMFDWILNIHGGWNFYIGPGAGLSYYYSPHYDYDGHRLGVNVGGQLGFEYQFGIPLNISLDWRPMWNVLGFGHYDHYYGDFYGFALGLRYRF